MNKEKYAALLKPLQEQLVELQEWIAYAGLRVVVVFEGRDASGKGGVIKTITQHLNPRVVRIAALGKPSDRERSQWYFQRYVAQLPAAGEMVLFDRSWYNRAGVERVMGFCSADEYHRFLEACPAFEALLVNDGIIFLKYWFSVSQQEQGKRFQARIDNPLKRWKYSDMDHFSRQHWTDYSKARDVMLAHTDTELCPWYVVEAENKRQARLNCLAHLLSKIPYQSVPNRTMTVPDADMRPYDRPAPHHFNYVPNVYDDENGQS